MNGFMNTAADKIKSLRRDHGMTQEDLAAKSGCGLATIQRAESGRRMSADTISSIAAAFGILATELTTQKPEAFAPYLPLNKIATARPLVALLLGCSRIDFGFCEIDKLDDAKLIELFYNYCLALTATNGPLSPIELVSRELEARDRLVELEHRGFQVGAAEFEITAYEVDDEDGGMPICYGQWDVSCVAIRVGLIDEEISRAEVLAALAKWETIKGDAVIHSPSARGSNDWETAVETLSPSSDNEAKP